MTSILKILLTNKKDKILLIFSRILSFYPNLPLNKFILNQTLSFAKISNKDYINNYTTLYNSIIIKPFVSEKEKGFLLISFEGELEKIVNLKKFKDIQNKYQIIFIPSWTGLFSSSLLKLASRSQEKFYVMPVHSRERILCLRLGSCCKSLPFNAASWVNSSFFSGYNGPRDIDCLMVANFATFKRHWILFKALSKLPSEISAVCVGTPWGGRTADSLKKEANEYGVLDRVVIIEEPSQKELRNYFQRAKVFCALSHKEGSYVGVAESLLAGTPVIMFKNADIGTKELIGFDNGSLISSISELREKILYFLHENNHENIRKNAQQQVDASINCYRLNKILKDDNLSLGNEWNINIEEIYCMRLRFHYKDKDAYFRFVDDYSFLKSNGIELSLRDSIVK